MKIIKEKINPNTAYNINELEKRKEILLQELGQINNILIYVYNTIHNMRTDTTYILTKEEFDKLKLTKCTK